MANAMELQHINVKIYVEGDLKVDPVRFIEVFHRWIQQKTLDELLIDVADYRHVPSGPGILLIGHEADYSIDNTGNQWGLRYNRKAPLEGSNSDRFGQALQSAARACRLLETELESAGPLKFSRQKFQFVVNDRALAPNTPETFATAKPQLEAFLGSLLGQGQFTLQHQDDPRSLFGVTVTAAKPFDFSAIAEAAP